MALETEILKKSIVDIMNDMKTRDEDVVDLFASQLSEAIELFVKSGSVEVNIVTQGTATSQTGKGIGTIT